ncbi:MAG: flagellar basal body-associated FliL family protein [Dehalococcoidia bacterium]|nr:flagellar basal body-associated FliL family protein [Dehalococcoidia bacterium]
MPDKKIMAGGAVLAGAAFWFYVKPNYLDAKPPPVYTEEQIAEAPRPTVYLGKAIGEEAKKGTAETGLVLNLKAPATAPAYAKVVIALEFEDPKHTYINLKGAAVDAANVVYTEELAPEMHKILDVVTTLFGSKTIDQVSTTEGREKLKDELRDAVNEELHHEKVEKVYFVTFVTQ